MLPTFDVHFAHGSFWLGNMYITSYLWLSGRMKIFVTEYEHISKKNDKTF